MAENKPTEATSSIGDVAINAVDGVNSRANVRFGIGVAALAGLIVAVSPAMLPFVDWPEEYSIVVDGPQGTWCCPPGQYY